MFEYLNFHKYKLIVIEVRFSAMQDTPITRQILIRLNEHLH